MSELNKCDDCGNIMSQHTEVDYQYCFECWGGYEPTRQEILDDNTCFHCEKELGVGNNDCKYCINENSLK